MEKENTNGNETNIFSEVKQIQQKYLMLRHFMKNTLIGPPKHGRDSISRINTPLQIVLCHLAKLKKHIYYGPAIPFPCTHTTENIQNVQE